MVNPYSEYKLLQWPHKINQIRNGYKPYPITIYIDLTNICNLKCQGCSTWERIRQRGGWLPFDKILEILEWASINDVKGIVLTGGGEPTLHPEWDVIVKKLSDLSISYGVVTNGVTLVDYGQPSWIRISLDAATSKTYQIVKGCSKIDKVLDNIKMTAKIFPDTFLSTSFVVREDNKHEVIDYIELSRRLGAKMARIAPILIPSGRKYKSRENLKAAFEVLRSKVIGTYNPYLYQGYPVQCEFQRFHDFHVSHHCYYHNLVMIITYTGDVYRCCTYKYLGEASEGNIFQQDIDSIWSNIKPIDTKRCPDCISAHIVRLLTYMVEKYEVHANFV